MKDWPAWPGVVAAFWADPVLVTFFVAALICLACLAAEAMLRYCERRNDKRRKEKWRKEAAQQVANARLLALMERYRAGKL